MNITEEALDEIEADAKYGAYVAPGTAVELIEEIRSLRADNADLLEAAQLALKIAESWIHDQLDGTSSIDGALRRLDPVRAAIARARGEV